MGKRYDLVVVGSGTAARTVATPARAAGWNVAVVDVRPFGGTCALRGCDAKKLLRSGPEVVDHVRRMNGKGAVGEVGISWPALMAFKRSFTDPFPGSLEKGLADEGIARYHGLAKFVGPGALEIRGETVEAEHVLLA